MTADLVKDTTPTIEGLAKDTTPTIEGLVKDTPMIDPQMTDSFFNTPIVIMPILIILAGIFYGIAFAFDSSQIRFILYCGSVWSICLAFIYYVNQTPTQTLLSSSSAE